MANRTLTNRVVAITGGARGIGAATAAAFASAGARVAIGDIDAEVAARTAHESGCMSAELDVTSRASFAEFLDTVDDILGPIDVLVNNAGIMPVVRLLDESEASIRRQLSINVEGVIRGTQLAASRMRPRGTGHIVNVASAAGLMGFGGVSTYSGTKFAVAGFTEAAALELRSTGVRLCTVYPAMVRTELAAGLSDHWLLRSCEPAAVAVAVVGAVQKDRRAVYVPRRLGPAASLLGALPTQARARLMGLFGADHQMLAGDDAIRADYDRRVDND